MTEDKLMEFKKGLEQDLATAPLGASDWSVFGWADYIRKIILKYLKDVDPSDLPEPIRKAIHDAVKSVYDSRVRSYNIPYIDGHWESMLEDYVWDLLCDWLCKILDIEMPEA